MHFDSGADPAIPDWALRRPKSSAQALYDLVGAPWRMILLPDATCERLHLTSLRAERFSVVLPFLSGRVLDVGAGRNELIRLYQRGHAEGAADSVGLDVVDLDAGCAIVPDCRVLPFPDESFDTVCFIACVNHIPERAEVLREARRVLRPGGRVVLTMIGRLLGVVGHALWWYSEDKHRSVHEEEVMGIDRRDMLAMLGQAGFEDVTVRRFVYGLNNLFVGRKPVGRP